MKVMLITTPIRPVPTDFPPIGSLSIISYLNRHGIEDVEFYHIDANRPRFDDAVRHIVESRPDVLGISSVVSTAYEYTKRISLAVKQALPDTLIVLGGNLAASAEAILRRTGVDLCVLGEGEQVFLDIVNRARTTRVPGEFADISGLAFIGDCGLVNTGYPDPIDKAIIYDIDWSILERATDIGIYFRPVLAGSPEWDKFKHDPRGLQPEREGKRLVMVPAAKGCVARCTFCHRWDKGIRYIPPEIFVARLQHLVERYNVGFIQVADENFGTDRRWLAEFCSRIKPLDILWRVAGMRVNCITPEQISMMKDAGCVAIHYGMETGSPRMLEVMEKKTTQPDNENALRWTLDSGMRTVVQLVVGMPGETHQTVRETIEFCKWANSYSPEQSPNDLSINYAQALPGTPLYEFGRHRGLIASGLDGEEAYLQRISDKDAHDEVTTLNFTDYPSLICETWRPLITIETNYAYVRKYGLQHYLRRTLSDRGFFAQGGGDSGYFANPKRLVDTRGTSSTINDQAEAYVLDDRDRVPPLWQLVRRGRLGLAMICYPIVAYRFRHLLIFLVIYKNLSRNGAGYTWRKIRECLVFQARRVFGGGAAQAQYRSLRKIVNNLPGSAETTPEMVPLRKGR